MFRLIDLILSGFFVGHFIGQSRPKAGLPLKSHPMRLFAIARHKYLTNIIAITALLTAHNAFAFELPTQLLAEITPPALFATIEPVSYSYMSNTAVSMASPITQKGNLATAPRTFAGSNVVMEGIASYYSKAGCLGCNPLFIMANGQVLNDNALTMAIGADKKHLVGYNARVTSLVSGKSVVVRITDTGGFYKDRYGNRVADLTIGTKEAIGMKGGLGRVRVEVL